MEYSKGFVYEKRKEGIALAFDSNKLVNLGVNFRKVEKGEFSGYAILLSDTLDWSIIKDDYGQICLVAIIKE